MKLPRDLTIQDIIVLKVALYLSLRQHIRAILNLPLPKPRLRSPTVMVNILGPNAFEGEYVYGWFE